MQTDDGRRDHDDLRARGVEFRREPKEMPYDIEALFRDASGNLFSLTERR